MLRSLKWEGKPSHKSTNYGNGKIHTSNSTNQTNGSVQLGFS